MKYFINFFTISILIFHSSLIAQWVRYNGAFSSFYSFAASDTNIFAGNSNGKILRSTDDGTSWTIVYSGSPGTRTDAFAISDTNIFAANDVGVLRSTNNGTTWTSSGLTNLGPQALAISPNDTGGTYIFAGTFHNGIFRSGNNGASWSAVDSGLTGSQLFITALFASDTNIFAGTWGGGAFRSTDNGTSWIAANAGLTSNHVHAFTVAGTNLFAGTYFGSGVYFSTDNGEFWTTANTGLTNSNVRALALHDTNIFAGTDGGGVFRSDINGISWTAFNEGLTNNIVNVLIVYGSYIFAGTGDGIWRRPISDITGVEDQSNGIPYQYVLKQNYPNPFNPSTTIKYLVPSPVKVIMKIYGILGNEIAVLLNEEKPAGAYALTWNAVNLPSGVYFYRIQAGNFIQTKKMILLK